MAKTNVLKRWIEVSQEFIHNQPPQQKNWKAYLFTNDVEVREMKKGKRLVRQLHVVEIPADSKDEMDAGVEAFMSRGDVRLLRKGLECNVRRELPSTQHEPPAEVIDGTAAIYEPAHSDPAP